MVGGGLGLVGEGLGGIGYEVMFFNPLGIDLFPASHVEVCERWFVCFFER